jgi:outer membrane protein OmpA-like peptidoglycan-associated protein
MKKCLVMLCLLSLLISAVGQQPPPTPPPSTPDQAPRMATPESNLIVKEQAPTYSDMYCAGFISNQSISAANYVSGGWESPDATRFAERNYIYLAGPTLEDGSAYTILRDLRDPNAELFKGQRRMVASLGSAYAELGRVRVIGHSNKVSIGKVEFSCDNIVPGDIVVPFIEHPAVSYRTTSPFDRFAPPNGKTTGRIVMAKDFDYLLGTGRKVYLDIGADKGVKPGDYFRVVRSSTAVYENPVDSLSRHANLAEDTQKHPPSFGSHGGSGAKIDAHDYPRKSLGELIVLNVTPRSATGMITFALQDLQVGDGVEMEDVPPPPPPPPPVAPQPPMITCSARPSTVRVGDTSTITANAESPDNRPLTIAFAADRGQVTGNANIGTLATSGAGAGPITVTCSATDDRNLSATATTMVNVEASLAAGAASKLTDILFAPNSARVDNKAKAILDEIALRLQRETDAKVTVVGFADTSTPAGQRLAAARANNVKAYLTHDKGIDEQRISTRTDNGGDKAEIWWVPAGAQPPQ